MKKLTGLILVTLLIALTACGVPAPAPKPEAGSSAAPAAPSGSGDKAKEITIASNGGKIETMVRDVIAPKFKEKYGIKVNYISGLSADIVTKLALLKDAPQVDIAMVDASFAVTAAEQGLTESIDEKDFPQMAKIDKRYIVGKTGVPVLGYAVAIGYNTKTFDQNGWKPIVSWNDLIRPEYKGMTALPDVSSNSGFTLLYSMAMANGGGLDNMQPGIDKAKELAAYSDTFYKNSTQIQPVMQQGGAVTVQASYTLAGINEAGVPVKMVIPKEGAPLQSLIAAVVKNAPHKKEAVDFINFLLSEDSQKEVANIAFYPVLTGMKMPDKYESVIGLKSSDNLFKPDFDKISKIQKEWVEKWMKEVPAELGKKVKK